MAKILLVDDTETYLRIERNALGPSHEYLLARNGREAVDQARAELPDLIVMDMSMPLMSGEEAIRILKADERTTAVPVIVITAEPSHEQLVRSLGCADFIRKPFENHNLLTRVSRVLAAAQTARAAVLVKAAGCSVAIPLELVREVLNRPALAELPGAPRHILGLLNLRGESIPVFDLMSRLKGGSNAEPVEQFIVVSAQEGHVLGVCVDDAEEVVEIERGAFLPVDQEVAASLGSLSRAVIGTWLRDRTLIPLLSPLKLLPEATVAQLRELAGTPPGGAAK